MSWTMKQVCFNYWQEQEIFLSYVVLGLARGLTQPHVVCFPGGKGAGT